jgi:hypothetical protein
MSDQRLNQVIVVEQGIKNQVEKTMTETYHLLQKATAFDGMNRSYRPALDGGDKLPAENKKVQHRANDLVDGAIKKLVELFDITAAKDVANCNAKADVAVDGVTILKDVPATFLLFLEKKLTDVHTLISKLPTLDAAETWATDENNKLWKTGKVEKARTQKVPKVVVLHPPTEQHPAQTQLIHEDVTVGFWEETRLSGAYPQVEQKRLLEKLEALQVAVKKAREKANMVMAPQQEVGAKIFEWLFK